ncbi:MAG: hypothetical protein ABSE64_08855 [Vulcanimicrobiaceae bacterium]|jgi:hypothetical protein
MRLFLAAAIVGLSTMLVAPAFAQTTMDNVGPHNAYCGSWQNGVFAPNGNCVEDNTTITTTTTSSTPMAKDNRMHTRVVGTITGVRGHLVTIQGSTQTLVINDSQALATESTGRVAVGRQVTARGYWEDGTFYALRME